MLSNGFLLNTKISYQKLCLSQKLHLDYGKQILSKPVWILLPQSVNDRTCYLNSFVPNAPFLYPLETSENHQDFRV